MTGSFFQTIPEVMTGVAGDCDRTASEFEGQFQALQTYCRSLDGIWLGPAAVKFDDLMVQWDVLARDLNIALRGIAQGLRTNAQDYVEGEMFNEGEINKIYEMLPPQGKVHGVQASYPPVNI